MGFTYRRILRKTWILKKDNEKNKLKKKIEKKKKLPSAQPQRHDMISKYTTSIYLDVHVASERARADASSEYSSRDARDSRVVDMKPAAIASIMISISIHNFFHIIVLLVKPLLII